MFQNATSGLGFRRIIYKDLSKGKYKWDLTGGMREVTSIGCKQMQRIRTSIDTI